MTALPIEGYAKDYTPSTAAQMFADYAARKRRLAKLFSTGIREGEITKAREIVIETRPAPQPAPKLAGGVKWAVEEVALLRRLHAERKNSKQVAQELGRSIASVTNKAWSLSLTFEPVPKPVRRGRVRRDWLKVSVKVSEPLRASKQLVLATVCEMTGHSAVEIRGLRRDKQTVISRHIAYLMMKRHTPLSLPQIGAYMGDKDHTTILSGVGSIQHKAASDLDLAHQIEAISAAINSRVTVSDKPIAVAEAA
jgi:hypothetical protein